VKDKRETIGQYHGTYKKEDMEGGKDHYRIKALQKEENHRKNFLYLRHWGKEPGAFLTEMVLVSNHPIQRKSGGSKHDAYYRAVCNGKT